MLNDQLIRDLAQIRINDLYEAAEADRLARLARSGRRADRVAYLPQLFASLRQSVTRIAFGATAAIPRQRSSIESQPEAGVRSRGGARRGVAARHRLTAGRAKSRPSTQCC
ncbi:MAG TPA: hypothetical protein VE287_02750 [Actinopolymorphaceae bacterium]|nr:hypothetical protein [Actinopolymorphaceae bacterium]